MIGEAAATLTGLLFAAINILRLPRYAHWSDIGWYGLGPLVAHASRVRGFASRYRN